MKKLVAIYVILQVALTALLLLGLGLAAAESGTRRVLWGEDAAPAPTGSLLVFADADGNAPAGLCNKK